MDLLPVVLGTLIDRYLMGAPVDQDQILCTGSVILGLQQHLDRVVAAGRKAGLVDLNALNGRIGRHHTGLGIEIIIFVLDLAPALGLPRMSLLT